MLRKIKNIIDDQQLKRLSKSFDIHSEDFDTKSLEREIEALAWKIYQTNKKRFTTPPLSNNIAIGALATQLYGSGGHTSCYISFVKSFYKDYRVECFLVRKKASLTSSTIEKIQSIINIVSISGCDRKRYEFTESAIELYNLIVTSGIKALTLFLNQNDFTSALILCWIRKFTNIRIIMFNLADHQPVVGMTHAHKILDFRPPGFELTQQARGYTNNILVDLQSTAKEDLRFFSDDLIREQREKWHAKPDEVISLTGCNNIKLFNGSESPYFEMIRDLLLSNPRQRHIVVAQFKDDQVEIIDRIFNAHKELRSRLVFNTYQSNFDILLQSADIFIDSFPQGSALTHIDCMRNKLPTVLKADRKDPFKSFEFYMPENYHFVAESVTRMKILVQELVESKAKRDQTSELLFDYFFQRYERDVVKQEYQKIIEAELEH